ncbi:hypothetical protein MRX96_000610 [Rhipicephalus microplus]
MGKTWRGGEKESTQRERGEADWGVAEKVRSSPRALTGLGKEGKTNDAELLPSICAARRQAVGTVVPTGTGPFPSPSSLCLNPIHGMKRFPNLSHRLCSRAHALALVVQRLFARSVGEAVDWRHGIQNIIRFIWSGQAVGDKDSALARCR